MGHTKVTLCIALAVVIALLMSACAPAATPTPTATKPAAAPTKAPEATKPAAEATKPAAQATKAPEATKPAAAAPKPPEGPLPRTVTLATASPGTTLYSMGTGLAKVATDVGPVQVIVQPFAGGPAWIPQMVSAGKPEVGLLNSVEGWQALTGKATPKPLPEGMSIPAPYEKAFSNLRALMMGTDLNTGMLVRKDSKYQTTADLKGSRIAWGFKAHAGAALAAYTNAALMGFTAKDFQPVEIPGPAEAVRGLAEGRLDAACVAVGMGAIAEADAQVGVRFLDASKDPANLKVAQGMMPGGRVVTLKGGSSPGIVKDTEVWGYPTVLLVQSNMPDNVAYTLVKTWWENHEKLGPLSPSLKNWKPDIFVSKTATVPYHPGAIAFYKEKGVWSAEMDQNQQVLMKGDLPFLK